MKNTLSRRTMLKAAGVALALPQLEAMETNNETAQRFIGIQMPFGFLSRNLHPKNGQDAFNSKYMQLLKPVKDSVTLFNGLHNPGLNGGHEVNYYFLTGGSKKTTLNTVSIDQLIAEKLYGKTRFNSIVTGVDMRAGASYTRSGIKIPMLQKPKALFEAIFLRGSKKDIENRKRELARGKSILDVTGFYEKEMSSKVSKNDSQRIKQYFQAVRTVEKELQMSEQWLDKPYPKVKPLTYSAEGWDPIGTYRDFMKVFKLIIETDSCRSFTFDLGQSRSVLNVPGVTGSYHGLSHHREVKSSVEQLTLIESEMFKIFSDFLQDLQSVKEGGKTLLDNSTVVFGSGLENPNNHSAMRPPLILAGGGHKHRGYVYFEKKKEVPISNLYVDILNKMGINEDRFGSSNGRLTL